MQQHSPKAPPAGDRVGTHELTEGISRSTGNCITMDLKRQYQMKTVLFEPDPLWAVGRLQRSLSCPQGISSRKEWSQWDAKRDGEQ